MENISANLGASLPDPLEIGESLYRAIRSLGLTVTAAAAAAGIDRHTFSLWQQVSPGSALRLAAAREQFREAQLTAIMLGRKNWRAATWLLERIFPADYHPRAAERARFRQAEAESAPTTEPASSSKTVLQNSPIAPPDAAPHLSPTARVSSVTPLQNPTITSSAPIFHHSPISGFSSETLLQKSHIAPIDPGSDPARNTASPSDPVLQNPSPDPVEPIPQSRPSNSIPSEPLLQTPSRAANRSPAKPVAPSSATSTAPSVSAPLRRSHRPCIPAPHPCRATLFEM